MQARGAIDAGSVLSVEGPSPRQHTMTTPTRGLVPPAMSLPLGSSPHTPSPLQRAAVAKHNVLPFQRSCGTRQRDVGTSQSQIEPVGSTTAPIRRSSAFGDHNSPRTASPRVQQKEKVAPRRVLQGFDVTHTGTSLESQHGVSSATGTAGLLTRQLSGGLTQTREIAAAPAFVQQRRRQREQLEQCLDKQAVTPPSDVQPVLAPPEQLLPQLQEKHAVFSAPVVKRAFCIASATFSSPAQLEANAGTAAILADLRLDADTVAAALLQGALDASPLTGEQLAKLVPPGVAAMVAATSRINSTCIALQADHSAKEAGTAVKLQTMLLAMADVRAVLVVLASKLQRMRASAAAAASGAGDLRVEATEGLRVFAPLANRLGVWSLKAELEDLCFLVLHPARAQELQALLAQPQSRTGLNEALTSLKERLDAAGLTYQDLSGRPKNLYGVHSKLTRKGFFADLRDIHDVRALRLIVDSKQDCYAALREVVKMWEPLPGRFKDYIRKPKQNGYQSLHTVVRAPDGLPIEVQIRTAKMHYIAEYGLAAHWRYKEALGDASAHTDKLVGWARYLITWKMELEDGKCRPRGSPPRDTSLASLFPGPAGSYAPGRAADGSPAPVSGGAAACVFPAHEADCRFAKFVHSERFVSRQPQDSSASPVYVVLLDAVSDPRPSSCSPGGSLSKAFSGRLDGRTPLSKPLLRIQEVPAGTTVGDLVSGLVPEAGAAFTPAHVAASSRRAALRVLVNHQESDDMAACLTSGDQLEIVAADEPSGEHLQAAQPGGASPHPPSPKRAIPTALAPRPTLGPAAVGNILPTGGLSRRLKDGGVGSSTASGRRSDFDSDDSSSGAAAAHHSVGLPASESTPERRGQAGSQRQEISRVLSGTAAAQPAGGARQSWGDVDLDVPPDSPARTAAERVEAIISRPDFLPAHMRSGYTGALPTAAS